MRVGTGGSRCVFRPDARTSKRQYVRLRERSRTGTLAGNRSSRWAEAQTLLDAAVKDLSPADQKVHAAQIDRIRKELDKNKSDKK